MNAGAGPSRLRDGAVSAVADDDFDSYIADLILADAKASQAKYDRQTTGRRTFFDPSAASGPGPKPTNKRFLSNVIRDVDAHNRSVIRQQRQAADDANAQRSRLQDRARNRSKSPALSNGRDYNAGPGPSKERRYRHAEATPHPSSSAPNDRRNDDARVPQTHPGSIPNTGSKMDKYFEDSYDPAFDIDMSRLEDSNTGLIGELPEVLVDPSTAARKATSKMSSDSANWTEMLDVVGQRDAEKARRKAERAERRARKAERAAERDRRNVDRPDSGKTSMSREWDKDKRRSPSTDHSDSDQHSRRKRSKISSRTAEDGHSRSRSERPRHSRSRSPELKRESGRGDRGDHKTIRTRESGGSTRRRDDSERKHRP